MRNDYPFVNFQIVSKTEGRILQNFIRSWIFFENLEKIIYQVINWVTRLSKYVKIYNWSPNFHHSFFNRTSNKHHRNLINGFLLVWCNIDVKWISQHCNFYSWKDQALVLTWLFQISFIMDRLSQKYDQWFCKLCKLFFRTYKRTKINDIANSFSTTMWSHTNFKSNRTIVLIGLVQIFSAKRYYI